MSFKTDFLHVSDAAKQALKYIEERKDGLIKPLITPWSKLNSTLLGGLNFGEVTMYAGMSGTGKTLFVSQLETGLFEANKNQDFAVLSFNFEMLARMLIIRKLSSKLNKSIHELLSVDAQLDDFAIQQAKDFIDADLANYPLYYVDFPHSVLGIRSLIDDFQAQIKKPFVVTLDHTLLVKKVSGQNTLEMVDELSKLMIEYKKKYEVTFVLINQLNRNIESEERIKRPSILNYPQRSDLYYVESLYHACDNIIVGHRPQVLNLTEYGPNKIKVSKEDLFFHCIKVRNGETVIIKARIDGKTMKIVEA